MNLTQFTTTDRAAWREALARFAPHDDVYFQPEYALAYEANGDGKAQAVLVAEGDAALFVPVLRCPIPDGGGACDIQSAYGYGGPLAVHAPPEFLSQAWGAIRESWMAQGAVAAFLRSHPLLGNEGWFGPGWNIVADRTTISVDLCAGADAAFAHPAARKHRRDVAWARRTGATVHFRALEGEPLEDFRALYAATMTRLGAGSEYFFSADYFASFANNWPETASIVEVRDADGALASTALIFWGSRWAHYHLGARQTDSQNHNTFHLLFQAVAEEAVRRGLTALHLGGGRTPHPDDTLLQFKRRVGASEHRFSTARLVLDPARYNELVSDWRRRHPDSPALWFLAYRQRPEPLPQTV